MTDRRFYAMAVLLSAGVGGAVMLQMRRSENLVAVINPAVEPAVEPERQIPDLARVLRALKVVTVEIDTGVSSTSHDESWRGDVRATVVAPARFYYGVDLAGLTSADVWKNPLTGAWTLRVPNPERIAVEVGGGEEKHTVRVGGTRLRDVAGEYHLGLARVSLFEQARRMTLTPDDRERLRTITREQLTRLTRAILGADADVHIEFADGDTHASVPDAHEEHGERSGGGTRP